MKFFLLIFLTFLFFISCDNKTSEKNKIEKNEIKCKKGFISLDKLCIPNMCITPNPCTKENRTICSPQKESPYFNCKCDNNFHLENNKCITDIGSPCFPNPCTETNKTRCLLNSQDNTKAECHCDINYHSDGNLCCQAFSHNENGSCICNEDYIQNPKSTKECLIKCSKKNVEAFHGYCEDTNTVCVNGECINNLCKNISCPLNSDCIIRESTAQCQCQTGLHMSNNLCCIKHSSNINNECKCDDGYTLTNGQCTAETNNPCEINGNPCTKLHKNKCIVNGDGYSCVCNTGYQNDNGKCKIITTGCGEGFTCLNNYCVKDNYQNGANYQCLVDSDCNLNGGIGFSCNSSALGGICGCNNDSDCPGDLTICNPYGTCSKICDNDNDCLSGKCYSTGYCGLSRCNSVEDCPYGSTCIDNLCKRIPCTETDCSVYHPTGICENGKTCVYGNCINSCSPNPCNKIPMKTVCSNAQGVISCSCESGYTENENGKCIPKKVEICSNNFTCENGYCADRNDTSFVCANDNDCGNYTSCSTPMTLPSGKCIGCSVKADCPHEGIGSNAYNPFVCLSGSSGNGYCIKTCNSQSECNNGMVCDLTNGFCKKKACTSSANCPIGYICNGSSLKCERIPCTQ